MGKSQFQAAKAARYASTDAEQEGQEFRAFSDGMTDVSYHTPAWHQARIEALMKPRMSYEEWKQKAKEQEGKMAAAAESDEQRMREYRKQLDADRAARMGKAAGGEEKEKDKKDKSKKKKKSSKDKKSKRSSSSKDKKSKRKRSKDSKSSKKKRRRDDSSSSSSSGSDDSSSDSDSGSSSGSDSGDEGLAKKRKRSADEPVKLSEYLKS